MRGVWRNFNALLCTWPITLSFVFKSPSSAPSIASVWVAKFGIWHWVPIAPRLWPFTKRCPAVGSLFRSLSRLWNKAWVHWRHSHSMSVWLTHVQTGRYTFKISLMWVSSSCPFLLFFVYMYGPKNFGVISPVVHHKRTARLGITFACYEHLGRLCSFVPPVTLFGCPLG